MDGFRVQIVHLRSKKVIFADLINTHYNYVFTL